MADWDVVSVEDEDPWRVVQFDAAPGQAQVSARPRTLMERFTDNVSDAFHRGTLNGAGMDALATWAGGQIDKQSVGGGLPLIDQVRDLNRDRSEQYDQRSAADPFYKSDHPILSGIATLGGQLVGSTPTPESAVGWGRGPLARRMAIAGGVGVGTDIPTQMLNQYSGSQENYDPLRTVTSGAINSVFPVGEDLARVVSRAAGRALKKMRERGKPAPAEDPWRVVDTAPEEAPAPHVANDDWTVVKTEPEPKVAAAAPSPSPFASIDDAKAHVRQIVGPVTFTSDLRTPEHNAAVGGAKNSNHLTGHALDFVPPKGMTMAQAAEMLRASGIPFRELLNEGDHIHVAWGRGGKVTASTVLVGRSIEDEVRAALTDIGNEPRPAELADAAPPAGAGPEVPGPAAAEGPPGAPPVLDAPGGPLGLGAGDKNLTDLETVLEAASREGGHAPEKHQIAPVADWLVEAGQQHGLDLGGFSHTVDASAVRHIRTQHGDADIEMARGQLPVTDDDIRMIPDIVASPDRVIFGSKNRRGLDQVVYLKRLEDGSIMHLEEARRGRHELAAISMRKYPATIDDPSLARTLDPNGLADGGDGLKIIDGPEGDKPLASRGQTLPGARRPGAIPSEIGKVGSAAYAGENLKQMSARLNRILGLTSRQGRMTLRRALGQYDPKSGVIRTKQVPDFDVLVHEGGHALDFRKLPELEALQKANAAHLRGMAYPGADPKHLREEGFAEFFRWYLTNPDYARGRAGQFYDDFEATLGKVDPALLRQLQEVQAAHDAWQRAPSSGIVARNITAQERRPTTGPLKRHGELAKNDGTGVAFKTFVDDAYTAAIDRFAPLGEGVRELQRIARENGRNLDDIATAKNPYRLARMVQGAHASALMDIKEGVRGYHQVDPQGPALQQALETALGKNWNDDALRDFGAYLASRRLVHEWDRFRNGELEREPDGIQKAGHVQNIIDSEVAHPTWKAAAQMVYDWTEALWKKRFDAGLITQEAFEAGAREHPDYVPLMRDLTDKDRVPGRATGRGGKFAGGVKEFRGSSRPIINPIQSLMREAFELNTLIARNDVMLALDAMAKAAGKDSGRVVERVPDKEVHGVEVNIADAAESAAKRQGLGRRDQIALRLALEAALGDDAKGTVFHSMPINEKGEPIVFAWKGGKRLALRLPDGEFGKQMFDALAQMTPDQKNFFVDAMAGVAMIQRAGITSAPAFLLRNFFRDQFSAWMLTDVGYKPFASSIGGMVDELTHGKLAKEYSHMGGLMGGANVSALSPAMDLKPRALKKGSMASLARGLVRFTELSETGTRLGIYRNALKTAKKQGLSPYEAAVEAVYEARDYFDTGLNGASNEAKLAKRLIPFFNANIQGLRKAASVGTAEGNLHRLLAPLGPNAPRSASERRAFVKAYKLWAKVAAVGVAGATLSMLAMQDPEFREFDDRERATHWFVKTDAGWVRLPKPFELAALSNIFERALERYVQDDPTAWERMRKDLAEVLVPPLTTPALSVPWELARNKDYAGRPIVPEGVDGKVDPALQSNSYTSDLARRIGKAANVSPAAVDHALAGFGGTWGRDASRLSNKLSGQDRMGVGWSDAPVVSAFTSAPERGTDSAAHFWQMMASDGGSLSEREGSFRTYIKAGDFDKALTYLHKLEPVERDYVLSQVFSQKGSGKLHPMERARLANGVYGDLRRDFASGSPVRMPNGDVLELKPEQAREADQALAQLQMADLSNGMKAAGVKGWAQRPYLSRQKAAEALKDVDPRLVTVLDMRMAAEKVPSPAQAVGAWPQLQKVLTGLSDGQLRDLMAQERLQSASTKLDEKLRRAAMARGAAQ